MRTFIIFLGLLLASNSVSAKEREKIVNLTGSVSNDTYLFGDEVKVNATVNGDLLIAASEINVEGAVSGDLMAAGGEIDINAELQDDLRAAGGEVSLCSHVAGDAAIAGGDIMVCANAIIASRAWLAGSDIHANGRFEEKLVIKGGDVVLAGVFTKGVDIEASSVEVLSGARIIGDLEYTSPIPAKIHDDAVITGKENYTISNPWWAYKDGKLDTKKLFFTGILTFIGIVFSLAITTLIVSGVLPKTYAETPTIIRTQFFKCLGIGLIFVLVTPVSLMILTITIVGIPLAIIFFLTYVLMFFIGFFASVTLLADSLYQRIRKSQRKTKLAHLVSITVATLFVLLFSLLPVIGGLFFLFLILTGIGAVCLFIAHTRKFNATARTISEE